ncbi:MAG: PKD domain-containing protein [Candidatus Brocadiaceae bacterium]|nr:PKD domain-containing protein [Candidatus Brocadiaceae bacterium]
MGRPRAGRPLAVAVLAMLVTLGGAAGAREDWHAPDMPCRLLLSAVPAARRGGLNTVQIDLAEQSERCRPDGADIRVTTPAGRAVPHRIEVGEQAAFRVYFQAPEDCDHFHLYYGSGEALPASEPWTETLGGLYLETRPLSRPLRRAAELPAAVRQHTERHDRQPWKQVWDQENPFGPDDLYLSIYEGTLYCPESGDYVFAVSSDDGALFGIEGTADLLCWRDPGVLGTTWRDPAHPRAVRKVRLERGVYRIHYHHFENYGGQLAKLGWQTPSSDAIVLIPPGAFIHYLPADIEGLEMRDDPLSPFFTATHCYTVRINGREPGFPRYRFESRVAAASSDGSLEFEWDFGDGTVATGPEVIHEFAGTGARTVTLLVRDADGREASVTRPVFPAARPTSEVLLEVQSRPASLFAQPGDVLPLQALVLRQGGAEQEFVLQATVRREGRNDAGTTTVLNTVPGTAGESARWTALRVLFPVPEDDVRVTVSAQFHGVEVARDDLVVLGTDGVLRDLALDDSGELRRAGGARVALRTAGATRSGASPRCLCEPGSTTVDVLIIDDALGGPPGSPARTYGEFLAEALEGLYSGLRFVPRRAAAPQSAGIQPMAGFLHVASTLARSSPNLVILVCQPDTVINGTPVDEFEAALSAALDQVLVRSRAEAVLVGPPPVPGRPDASRAYAAAAKRLGLRKGVPVVDLYSRFRLMPDWEALFQPPDGQGTTYLVHPNEQGQRIIAREIMTAVTECCHEGFSAAVRHAAYWGESGGS